MGRAERVELPQRNYLLCGAPLDVVHLDLNLPWDQSPNLWWPDDAAWGVATEVDLAWTYVGGTRQLIKSLLLDDRLEVLEAAFTDQIGYETDLLNAALDGD